MAADDYDLAGFTVGLVDKPKLIDSSRMAAGDVVLALPSSGFHSNGYSLVRKVFDVEKPTLANTMTSLAKRWARRCCVLQ